MPGLELSHRKRLKKDHYDIPTAKSSRIYQPFRSIGNITNNVPFDIQIKGTQFLLTTCIGRSIQTYDCARLNLLFVTSPLEHAITAINSQSDLVLVASGPFVVAYRRGKEVWRLGDEDAPHITQLLTFGDYICTTDNTHLLVYNNIRELHIEIELPADSDVTCLLHPATYLNKVVLANAGRLEIWNVRTGILVHSTTNFGQAITALTSSPVIDVICLGLFDGTIIVHHLRADEEMIKLKQVGRVNSISFRTDGVQIMATSNDQGEIAFWDLEKSKVITVLRTAHAGSVSSISYLNGQPILISTGTDNAVREWIFDSLDGSPRLLRSRSGHHAPPTSISFYGQDSHFLLSASRDRSLMGFSVYSDAQTTELSQGAVQSEANKTKARPEDLKLAEIVGLAWQNTREKDWDNVLTAHKDDCAARTWNWKRRRLGKYLLTTKDKTAVRSVAISACGNFGFVGSNSGTVDCYNMQSGLHRRTYRADAHHTKAVTGITSDSLNKVMISASLDGTVKFWDFQKGKLTSTVDIEVGITGIRHKQSSELLALSCDDFSIRVLDTETKRIVRELWGHTNRITSMAFSDDARWLVTSSLDGTIRTFDLPTGHTIDILRIPSVCTALAFSPTGDYLATAHIDSVGIHLWSNRAQFTAISTHNITDEAIPISEMPSASGEGGQGIIELALQADEDVKDITSFTTIDQLSASLLTMSMVPRTRWQNLLNLDIIRQRNKPKEPPKAPEKLPFDLGTLRDLHKGTNLAAPEVESRHLAISGIESSTEFTDSLDDPERLFEHVKTLGPAQIDISIRSLSLEHDFHELTQFVNALTWRLKQRRDYELCQAYMATFLKSHGDVLVNASEELFAALEEWREVQEAERQRLSELIGYCNGVVRFLSEK